MTYADAPREGEVRLAIDPADEPADAGVVFIGRVRSPWAERADCPKNMREARERGLPATVEIDAGYCKGLGGLEKFSHVVVLTWFDRADRDLIVQRPRHADAARGTFALRSPVRPNPIGLHIVRLVKIEGGVLSLEAIDAMDGTPVLDIKPYFAASDAIADASDGASSPPA